MCVCTVNWTSFVNLKKKQKQKEKLNVWILFHINWFLAGGAISPLALNAFSVAKLAHILLGGTPANPHSQFWPFPVPPATFDRIHYRTKIIFYTDNKPSRLLLKLNLPHFMLGITMTAFSLDQSSPLLLFCLYMLQWGIGKVVVST